MTHIAPETYDFYRARARALRAEAIHDMGQSVAQLVRSLFAAPESKGAPLRFHSADHLVTE